MRRLFRGESEARRDDRSSRAKFLPEFRKQRIEYVGEEIGIDDVRILILYGEEIFSEESDGSTVMVSREVPFCEEKWDDVFLDADIFRIWFDLVTSDEYPRVATTEVVEDAFRLEGDGVNHFLPTMLFRG